ncbi:transglycosylase domain-containing protein [Paraliobacillus sp. X-1268]|uniref:transglycosylase domain-containing protein n=1 Tax=Paraliobacillus sp. X-1268 TaxID=2213193 RepID=UPI000E3E3B6A|nr:transglycosylase domain-containing protein [Paraliobacillus sp. X-1268]
MDFKRIFHKIYTSISSWWKKGEFQRISRIGYDIVWNITLFFIIIGVVGFFFAGGLGAGYFASLVKDEPVRAEADMKEDIYNYSETSEVYFADEVYMGEISSDLYREEVTLDQVSENVSNAIIATEDGYFETHNGVVPKAILRALFQEVTNSATKTGGSTLTQQIIKNQILTNEVSFERKAKEILLAMRVEGFLEKDEILEAYLNIVPFGRNANGRNIAGIQTAAEGIFNVDAIDLNIAQAAFIAGLPQSPITYTPFTNNGQIKDEESLQAGMDRMKTVLTRMLEEEYISEAEYNEALEYDIVANLAEPTPTSFSEYPYLTNLIRDRATEILRTQLAEADGYTEEDLQDETLQEDYQIKAERELSQGGYKIQTTINKEIYDAHQDLAANFNNYGPEKTAINQNTKKAIMTTNEETGEEEPLVQPVQVGGVLIDNATGKIISFVGGRDFDISNKNYATDVPRSIGSTAKPLIDYAPGMEEGTVQPGSIIADVDLPTDEEFPGNYSKGYHGLVTARQALTQSYNVPATRVFLDILDIGVNPIEKYYKKMGFSNVPEATYNSLAIGTTEASVEENVNAYATFGNNGNFTDAFIIEKIESGEGEVAYQHESESVKVFSEQTNYLMIDMMRDVVTQGTATTARANLNNSSVDWAGKTGTGDQFKDTWFVATNPNVTVGTWMGYDYNQSLTDGYSGRNQVFWAQLVNLATEIDPDLMAPSSNFERPDGIVSSSYCKTSGLLPTSICSDLGLVGSDIYNSKFVPTEKDNSLIGGRYVIVNEEAVIAGENTPEEFTNENGVAFNPDWLKDNGYDNLSNITGTLLPNNSALGSDVEVPSTDEIENDGKAPNAPSSVSKSGSALTWNKSSSNDVVGYRIYRANDPDSNFRLIGSTTDTNLNVGNSEAVYQVKAVDYFGQESKASNELEVGDFSEPEPEPEPENDNEPEEDTSEDNEAENENSEQEQEENNEEEESDQGNSENNEESTQDSSNEADSNNNED